MRLWARASAVLVAAMAASACGGESSDAPPLSRCELRHLDHSTLEDGTLFICIETVVGYDHPETCNADAYSPLGEVSAAPGNGPCPESGKRLGCHFAEFRNTVWGYSGDGAAHVDALCGTVSGGEIVPP